MLFHEKFKNTLFLVKPNLRITSGKELYKWCNPWFIIIHWGIYQEKSYNGRIFNLEGIIIQNTY